MSRSHSHATKAHRIPLCPRCGHEFPAWQPVHLRCALARLRVILSALAFMAIGLAMPENWADITLAQTERPPAADGNPAQPPAPAPIPAPAQAVIRNPTGKTSLRQGPDKASRRLGLLPSGTKVTVLAANGNWRQVRTGQGLTGWVSREFVQIPGVDETP